MSAPTIRQVTDDHCWIHGYEPLSPNPDRIVCGECWHCYPTEQDLIDAYNAMLAEIDKPPVTSVDTIFFCPICAHDF